MNDYINVSRLSYKHPYLFNKVVIALKDAIQPKKLLSIYFQKTFHFIFNYFFIYFVVLRGELCYMSKILSYSSFS